MLILHADCYMKCYVVFGFIHTHLYSLLTEDPTATLQTKLGDARIMYIVVFNEITLSNPSLFTQFFAILC